MMYSQFPVLFKKGKASCPQEVAIPRAVFLAFSCTRLLCIKKEKVLFIERKFSFLF